MSEVNHKSLERNNEDALESFGPCIHPEYAYTSKEHPTVSHKCKYMDKEGRCTRDNCAFDGSNVKICNKHWDTCIVCGKTITVPPHMMDIPLCDMCRGRFLFAETLPFTCLLCGQSQNRPSKAPFSQICDECFKNYIYCPNCRHWCQVSTSPAEGYDKL